MQRGKLDDLWPSWPCAREGSFTKAAAKRGVSQSASSLHHKELEARLKLRLRRAHAPGVSPRQRASGCCVMCRDCEEIEAEAQLGSFGKSLRHQPYHGYRICYQRILLPNCKGAAGISDIKSRLSATTA